MKRRVLDALEPAPGQIRQYQEILPAGDAAPTPPTEMRCFFRGENKTTKGDFIWDDESERLVMERWQRRGIKLLGDFEHQSLYDPPIIAPASCTYDIEPRNGELWAVNIKWTKRAADFISAREYLYTSQAFDVDEATRKIIRVINFALTNLPAADNIDSLVAANLMAAKDDREGTVLRALDGRLPTDVQALVFDKKKHTRATAQRWAKAHGFKSLSVDETAASYAIRQCITETADTYLRTISLANSGGVSARVTARRTNKPSKQTLSSETATMAKFADKIKEHMKSAETDKAKMAKACGLDADEMDKMLDSEPGEMAPEHQHVMDKLAKHLKVPVEHLAAYAMGHEPDGDGDDDDDDDEEDKKHEEDKALRETVCKLTGKTDLGEAAAVLQAMKSTHDGASDLSKQVVQLTAEISAMKGKTHKSEFDAIVEKAKLDGKLSPAELTATAEGTAGGFVAACRADGEKGIVSLRAFVSALPAKVKTTASGQREPVLANDGLTDEEREVALKMGNDPKKLAEQKKHLRSI